MAKATSAGILPVLAVAVVLGVPGCGGGSGDQTTASATESTSAANSPKGTSAKSKAPSPAEEEQRKAATKVKATTEKANKAPGKQGPSISAPKGKQEPEITPEQKARSNLANIALSSPATSSGSPLPATYTCDGKDRWPQLDWEGVPAGTAELALFAMNIEPVDEKIFFDWAVGGIDSSLSGIEAGKLPKGAVMGKNSAGKVGYSICPPSGKAETYMFALYALPKALSPKQGFDALGLREAVLKQSGNAGLMAVSYSRD